MTDLVSPFQRFTHRARTGLLLTAVLLAGCQTAPYGGTTVGGSSQPHEPTPENQPYQYGIYTVLAGELALKSGDSAVAAHWLARAAEHSGRPDLFRKAVDAALSAGEPAQAEAYARRWQQSHPQAREPLMALARVQLLQDQVGEAADSLNRLLAVHPQAEGLWADAAEKLAETAGAERAIRALRRLVKEAPDQAAPHLAYGHLLLGLGAGEDAVGHLRQALDRAPAWGAVAMELANALAGQEGLRVLADFVKANPDETQVRQHYGEALLSAGEIARAAEVFATLAEERASDPDIFLGLGLARMRQEEWQGAAQAFRRVLELEPGKDTALYQLGRVAEEQGRYKAAADYYGQVNAGRLREQARLREAVAAVRSGDLERALQRVREMRSFRPDEPEMYRLEAQILSQLDRLRAAEDVADQGIQRAPDHVELRFTRAMIRDRLGNLDGMEADIRRIIDEDPENARAYNYLGYSLADRGVRLAEALSLLRKAHDLAPDEGYILDSLGWVHFRLGNLAQAQDFLRQARSQMPDDPEVLLHLGRVRAERGDRAEARSLWRKALDGAPEDSDLAEELRQQLAGED